MAGAGVAIVASVVIAACGSSNNKSSSTSTASTNNVSATINGAGSTFAAPIYQQWGSTLKGQGLTVNYAAVGSGTGVADLQTATANFAGDDGALKSSEKSKMKGPVLQFPVAFGSITLSYNLSGIKSGLKLDGPTIANIFLGKVKTWNDPAIAKLNPKLKLPSDAITVVRRSDGSGTTFNFTDYLSKSNADWKSKVGSGTAVEWPVGVGAKGNEGVAGNIGQTKNAIGYVEYAYAKQNKLTYTALINKAGKTVQPTTEAFQAAAANADWAKAPGYYVILTDQPGEASWPITAATFILMHKDATDKKAAQEAIKFFKWSFEKGGKMAEELDYIPMPDSVVKLIEKTWSAEIKS